MAASEFTSKPRDKGLKNAQTLFGSARPERALRWERRHSAHVCVRCRRSSLLIAILLLLGHVTAFAADWPQYRGPTTDGISTEPINTHWPVNGPTVLWRNSTATNGFSSPVVSEGRVFAMSLKANASGGYDEYCVAINATNGATLWATAIDAAPAIASWDPHGTFYGGDGTAPWNTGDGTRTTPSAKDGRVFAASGSLRLVCLNATNGAILWNDDLQSAFGGTPPPQYDNCASPCLDDDLIFININTATNDETLLAIRTSDGSKAWSSQNENLTHATPLVTTIQGVRQVIFATVTGLVSVERNTGSFLWKFTYPFPPIGTSMGASPIFYSNTVYCTTAYGRGAAAAQIIFTNNAWSVTQLYYKHEGPNPPLYYSSIWMSPVCYQGYVYSLAGNNNGTFLTAPLSCIELATGALKWSTNNFGMGGLILVNSNLVAVTEKGALVLIQPNPNAYTELARFQAFTFTPSTPGKCWNSPSFSDGHLYVRSTREVINLDVSVPTPPVIAVQPRSRAAVVGSSPSFNVVVTNTPGNSYQWRFAISNMLTGRTNASLTLTNVQPTNFGDYTVVITNSGGAVTSSAASLTVARSPLISSNRISLSTLFLTFSTEFGPAYFVEYKNSLSAPSWSPFTNLDGTGLPLTITDLGTTNAARFYRIRLQ